MEYESSIYQPTDSLNLKRFYLYIYHGDLVLYRAIVFLPEGSTGENLSLELIAVEKPVQES